MPDLVMSRREFAGVPVTVFTAVTPQNDPGRRRVVLMGRISQHGGEIAMADWLNPTDPDTLDSVRSAR